METIELKDIPVGTEIMHRFTFQTLAIAWDSELPLDTEVSIIDGAYYITNI